MDIFIIIMAGGFGTRFWPLSRKKQPKQFLPIVSEKSMIEETVLRLLPQIPHSHIFTIANAEQSEIIKTLLKDLPENNIIVEPQAKNTAPSLMLASAKIYIQNPEGICVALPADHMIHDKKRFLQLLSAGAKMASQGEDIVTFGIPPTYPATGYGYIEFNRDSLLKAGKESFYQVKSFKEKPGAFQAKELLKKGNYYWNSGMFLWKAGVFANKIKNFAPDLYPYWNQMIKALRHQDFEAIKNVFERIPAISIDYALMEKTKGVLMGKGDFGWSDVGSWSSLADLWPRDDNGNAQRGECITLNAKNNLVYNPNKLSTLIGVDNLIIVNTKNALLICRKDLDQKVKEVVDKIKKKGKEDHL